MIHQINILQLIQYNYLLLIIEFFFEDKRNKKIKKELIKLLKYQLEGIFFEDE